MCGRGKSPVKQALFPCLFLPVSTLFSRTLVSSQSWVLQEPYLPFPWQPMPHRWRSPQAVVLKPHTTWSTLGDSSNPLHLLNNTNRQNNTAEIVSLFMSLSLIADLCTHCQELSLAILLSLLSWAWAPHRCVDQSPLGCGCLSVVPHLMFFHPHLCVCSGPESCTIHKHRWHEHTPVHAHVWGTGTEP